MGQFSQRVTKQTMYRKLPKAPPGSSAVAMDNAQEWNKPGGGYDNYIKSDRFREARTPPGAMLPREPVDGDDSDTIAGKDKLKKAMGPKY